MNEDISEKIEKIKKKLEGLEKRLEGHEERIQELERFGISKKLKRQEIYVGGIKEGIEKLAKKTGISEEKTKEIFDLEENVLTVIKTLGETGKDKIQNTVLLVLVGYKYLFGLNEVLSQEIRRNVAENNIPLNNFGTYINEMSPSLVRRKGELRSPKTVYRLTTLGEARARELIKKVFGMGGA